MGVAPPGRTVWKISRTVLALVMLRWWGVCGWLRKWISIPSASCAVQMGVMVIKASAVWRQRLPAMEPESSITKIVSKVSRNAYASSATGAGAEGLLLDALDWTAAFGAAVYAGGASREDTL